MKRIEGYYKGCIIAKTPKSEEYPDSLWESLEVIWDPDSAEISENHQSTKSEKEEEGIEGSTVAISKFLES